MTTQNPLVQKKVSLLVMITEEELQAEGDKVGVAAALSGLTQETYKMKQARIVEQKKRRKVKGRVIHAAKADYSKYP